MLLAELREQVLHANLELVRRGLVLYTFGNASGISAPKISLLITTNPDPQAFVMASFVGQPLGSGTAALEQAGMRLGTVSVAAQPASPSASAGGPVPTPAQPSPGSVIVMQSPAPGQKVVAGTNVNFEVQP